MEQNMKLRHGLITLSDTEPTEVVIFEEDVVHYDASIIIQNIDESASVYLGASGVSSSNYGYVLGSGGTFSLDNMPKKPGLYAISDVDNSQIAVLRVSK